MKFCFAPSQLPNVSFHKDASSFGRIAEQLIYQDLRRKYHFGLHEIYMDFFGVGEYEAFLMINNNNRLPSFSKFKIDLKRSDVSNVRPDLLIHTHTLKEFYEIKPASSSGREAGISKVGTLSAIYKAFNLPYRLGYSYKSADIPIATLGDGLNITLSTSLEGPGLITYKICAESNAISAVAAAAILALVVKEIKLVSSFSSLQPINLHALIAKGGELSKFAQRLGLAMNIAPAERVGWKYFWRAVVKRFALRGAAAITLAETPTPMFVSQLMSIGLSIWMIIDIIQLSPELWQEAEKISKEKI